MLSYFLLSRFHAVMPDAQNGMHSWGSMCKSKMERSNIYSQKSQEKNNLFLQAIRVWSEFRKKKLEFASACTHIFLDRVSFLVIVYTFF
jgi:hypothetical protein